MWIQDVDGDLVNLNLVASIVAKRNNPWDDTDERWRVVASTGTSKMELDLVNATLFVSKNKEECKMFISALVGALGSKVIEL